MVDVNDLSWSDIEKQTTPAARSTLFGLFWLVLCFVFLLAAFAAWASYRAGFAEGQFDMWTKVERLKTL